MAISVFKNQKFVRVVSDGESVEFFEDTATGFAVWIKFADGSQRRFNNITEVHCHYDGRQTAIESDVHSTGLSMLTDIVEICLEPMGWVADDIVPEIKKAAPNTAPKTLGQLLEEMVPETEFARLAFD